jgi:hypothetical protein
MKLNVGVSKKQGLPDYGSVGASCHVEVELEGSLLQNDLETFHRHVRNAYVACSQAVADELCRHQSPAGTGAAQPANQPTTKPQPASRSNGNNGNGNGSNGHRASQKQRNYANQLAGQIPGLGARRMDSLSQKMFGKPVADLASLDASALIDTLKAIKDGQITVEDALDGAPV